MAVSIQDLLDEINGQETIANSILVIVQRLAAENDPAVRQQILDELKQNRGPLEAAVVAGTPQETPPTGGETARRK